MRCQRCGGLVLTMYDVFDPPWQQCIMCGRRPGLNMVRYMKDAEDMLGPAGLAARRVQGAELAERLGHQPWKANKGNRHSPPRPQTRDPILVGQELRAIHASAYPERVLPVGKGEGGMLRQAR